MATWLPSPCNCGIFLSLWHTTWGILSLPLQPLHCAPNLPFLNSNAIDLHPCILQCHRTTTLCHRTTPFFLIKQPRCRTPFHATAMVSLPTATKQLSCLPCIHKCPIPFLQSPIHTVLPSFSCNDHSDQKRGGDHRASTMNQAVPKHPPHSLLPYHVTIKCSAPVFSN